MDLLKRCHASMLHWYRLAGQASEGASVVERDGVVAAVVPAAPERSVVNAAAYSAPGLVEPAYDDIAARYAAIGASWTVWVHSGDKDTAAFLRERGHSLDAEPQAMGRTIDSGLARPPDDALEDWTADGDLAAAAYINDRSYPFGTDSFSRALRRLPAGTAQVYLARERGQPVATAISVDHGGNAEVQMVAVVPEARGRGLSGQLIAHALADAADRGNTSSSLVATRLGRPVYERLGYEPLGSLQMWERRPS